MEYSTTQQKDFYCIWYVTAATLDKTSYRSVLSREEYGIVAHELESTRVLYQTEEMIATRFIHVESESCGMKWCLSTPFSTNDYSTNVLSPSKSLKGTCNYNIRVSCTPSIPSTTKIRQSVDMSCCICMFGATKPAINFK